MQGILSRKERLNLRHGMAHGWGRQEHDHAGDGRHPYGVSLLPGRKAGAKREGTKEG
jgi:hypothetical protein